MAVEERGVSRRTGPDEDYKASKELREAEEASAAMGDVWESRAKDSRHRAAMRAKKRLFELTRCNPFDAFITLTLDGQRVDRYNYPAVIRRLSQWLDNMVRRRGLRYVIVPELHKDGALHFHGLINSDAVRMIDSGHKDKGGRTVYNLPDWKLGFTTAVRLTGDYGGVCHYVSKYVVKQYEGREEKPVGRYFYSGGELRKPCIQYVQFPSEPAGTEVEITDAGLRLVYVDPGAGLVTR